MGKSIYVIDPGMMEAGGHHAALLETLIHSERKNVSVSVLSHQKLDNDLESKAKKSGIQVHRFFSTNFYQHYDDSLALGFSGMQHYIRVLAWEYARALELVVKDNEQNEIVCFYPCLNWEHASALSIAMRMCSEQTQFMHKVCCMFKPITSDCQSELLYRSSFVQLTKYSSLKLFGSDWETRTYYEELGVNIQGFHPCYLLPWNNLGKEKGSSSDYPHFLLYMGDAKENKGFLRLPEVIIEAINKFKGKVQLTVQYTLAWDYPELVPVINTLNRLVKKYPGQLRVHNKFWSKDELQSVITTLSGVVCTYDSQVYQNKSSGLGWLCAYYYLPIIFISQPPFWMHREMARLGINYYHSLSDFNNCTEDLARATNRNSYYRSLFKDCLTWIVS